MSPEMFPESFGTFENRFSRMEIAGYASMCCKVLQLYTRARLCQIFSIDILKKMTVRYHEQKKICFIHQCVPHQIY